MSSLQLMNVKIPFQSDTGAYVKLLHEIIPEEKLLRWYIVKVEDGTVYIDAVYESDDAKSE